MTARGGCTFLAGKWTLGIRRAVTAVVATAIQMALTLVYRQLMAVRANPPSVASATFFPVRYDCYMYPSRYNIAERQDHLEIRGELNPNSLRRWSYSN